MLRLENGDSIFLGDEGQIDPNYGKDFAFKMDISGCFTFDLKKLCEK